MPEAREHNFPHLRIMFSESSAKLLGGDPTAPH
jgi:hypothetical protein